MKAKTSPAMNLGLLCGPLGIDPIGFLAAPAQAINLIRDPSYDFFQPVEAIEQGGEFEGVDPLHISIPFRCTTALVDA